jgi:ribosomal protein L32
MTTHEDLDALELPEPDTICPDCGEDLPHHNCQEDPREREEV